VKPNIIGHDIKNIAHDEMRGSVIYSIYKQHDNNDNNNNNNNKAHEYCTWCWTVILIIIILHVKMGKVHMILSGILTVGYKRYINAIHLIKSFLGENIMTPRPY